MPCPATNVTFVLPYATSAGRNRRFPISTAPGPSKVLLDMSVGGSKKRKNPTKADWRVWLYGGVYAAKVRPLTSRVDSRDGFRLY